MDEILLSPRRNAPGEAARKESSWSTEYGRMHEETRLMAASSPEAHPLQGSRRGFLPRPSRPLEDCFAATLPLQDAHGHCKGRSMMHLARRGDVRAAVAHLVIKGRHSVSSPARRTTRLSSLVIEGKLALRTKGTSTVGPPRAPVLAGTSSLRTVAFLLPLLSLLSWTRSMDYAAAMD